MSLPTLSNILRKSLKVCASSKSSSFFRPLRALSSTSQIATIFPLLAASFESLEPLPPTPIHAKRISSIAERLSLGAIPPATQYPAVTAVVDWRKRRRFLWLMATLQKTKREVVKGLADGSPPYRLDLKGNRSHSGFQTVPSRVPVEWLGTFVTIFWFRGTSSGFSREILRRMPNSWPQPGR